MGRVLVTASIKDAANGLNNPYSLILKLIKNGEKWLSNQLKGPWTLDLSNWNLENVSFKCGVISFHNVVV